MPKLNKRTIDALKPESKDYLVFDDEVIGFAIRVLPSGRKTFNIQYRAGGRTRRMSIGSYGTITAEEARKRARDLLGEVARGGNPAQLSEEARRTPTVAEACDRMEREHITPHLKPKSQSDYRGNIKLYIIPHLGLMRVTDVTKSDILNLQKKLSATPYQANRVVAMASKLFSLCELWELRPYGSNPCNFIPKFKEAKKERFLSPEEIARLDAALNKVLFERTESVHVVAAYRLLLLTGCRLREIQTAKWEYIYNGHLNLPDSKTGAKRVPLPDAAMAILNSLPREPDNPYIIIGKWQGQHITDFKGLGGAFVNRRVCMM